MLDKITYYLADRYQQRHEAEILREPSVQSEATRWRGNDIKERAVFLAFSGTPYHLGDDFEKADWPENVDTIIDKLEEGTFADRRWRGLSKSQSLAIQAKFDQYVEQVTSNWRTNAVHRYALSKARKQLKRLGLIILFLAAAAWGGYKIYQNQQTQKYWASVNASTDYSGVGFSATFPCSDPKETNVVNDSDLYSNDVACQHFGGSDHQEIDSYEVETTSFLSDKYSPESDMACGNPQDPTSGTIINEVDTINGVSFQLCDKTVTDDSGQTTDSGLAAFVQHGGTVYMLRVLPTDAKTTYSKLESFIRTFQLTGN